MLIPLTLAFLLLTQIVLKVVPEFKLTHFMKKDQPILFDEEGPIIMDEPIFIEAEP